MTATKDEIRRETIKSKLETLNRLCGDAAVTDAEFRFLYALPGDLPQRQLRTMPPVRCLS